jgi:hypothetical protein
MKTRLLHLIFCVCAFHLAQVQSGCGFIHTDGVEEVNDDQNCLCGPEKIPQYDKKTRDLRGPNSNSPYTSNVNYLPLSGHFQHKRVCKKITN